MEDQQANAIWSSMEGKGQRLMLYGVQWRTRRLMLYGVQWRTRRLMLYGGLGG